MAVEPKEIEAPKLTKKDFESEQDIRWCPGCGDYSVLATVQRFLPSLGRPREKFVFVSGIGCSSRFPYYMNTYGFHTVHGRAPAVATGVKTTNPELSVWVITGDGDALSIGGNHLLHLLRRNVDLNLLLFNNRIYGLTKGQYSPTSEVGKVTKSTPMGSIDYPLNPLLVALGARASFVARTLDVDAKLMTKIFAEAEAHRGTSFIEIYQNCNIFNDGAFEYVSERAHRDERHLLLRDGEPLVFGKNGEKGLSFDELTPRVVDLDPENPNAAKDAGVAIFDRSNGQLALALARLEFPENPLPMGVLYQETRPTFDLDFTEQLTRAKGSSDSSNPDETLSELYQAADTWLVS